MRPVLARFRTVRPARVASCASAQEVAAAIAYLASPLASATTGTALAVDGGMDGLRVRPEKS